jgi:hypothetical protein
MKNYKKHSFIWWLGGFTALMYWIITKGKNLEVQKQ